MSKPPRDSSRSRMLLGALLISGCGGSQSPAECIPLPVPELEVRCTADSECTAFPPLPATCGEGKCVAGMCRFRVPFANRCPCMPGEIRTCLLPSRDTGLQKCTSMGGIPSWGACQPVCHGC